MNSSIAYLLNDDVDPSRQTAFGGRDFPINRSVSSVVGSGLSKASPVSLIVPDSGLSRPAGDHHITPPLEDPFKIAERAKAAGRANAATMLDEYEQLLDEKDTLVEKELSIGLTPVETRRIAYIRWSLDRIDDARYGGSLDEASAVVERYKDFAAAITDVSEKINDAAGFRKRNKR